MIRDQAYDAAGNVAAADAAQTIPATME